MVAAVVAVVVALVVALVEGPAAVASPADDAAEVRLDVEWKAPPPCPDQAAFVRLVRNSVSVPPAAPVRIRARVEARRGQFHLTLRIESSGASGVRAFSAPGCTDLAKTAALIVALAVQPAGGPDQPEPDAAEPAAGARSVTAAVDDDEWPRPIALGAPGVQRPGAGSSENARRGLDVFGLPFDVALRLMVGGDSGLLPGLAPGVHAVLGAQHQRWRLEVGGSYIFEQRAPMPSDPDTGGLISVTTALLRSCAEVYRGPALASLCGGGELGRFRSTGYGDIMPISRSQTHAALSSGVSLAVQIRPSVYIRVDAGAAAMLVRPRFVICRVGAAEDCAVPLETFWQPERVVGRVQAGVEMVFQ